MVKTRKDTSERHSSTLTTIMHLGEQRDTIDPEVRLLVTWQTKGSDPVP